MSNFRFPAVEKATGKTVEIDAYDDHFGPRHYGYARLDRLDRIMTEEEFGEVFEGFKPDTYKWNEATEAAARRVGDDLRSQGV